jgi:hypothetical protein
MVKKNFLYVFLFWITHFGQHIWPNSDSGSFLGYFMTGFPGRRLNKTVMIRMHSFRLLIVIQTTFLIFFATTTRARRIAAYLHYFLATLVISSLSKAQLFLPTPHPG